MQEVREAQKKACYGDVLEISREDYVREVNQAGDGIWAVVHVYKNGFVGYKVFVSVLLIFLATFLII